MKDLVFISTSVDPGTGAKSAEFKDSNDAIISMSESSLRTWIMGKLKTKEDASEGYKALEAIGKA